jgi:ABC-type glycerol-3-phosphate transport system substrate-binding protein
MQRFNVFQTVMLGVFAALAVGGVLIFALFASGSASTSIGAVTLWGPFDEKTMNQLLSDLAETDQNYKQVTYVQKDAATYEDDLTEALASGTGPDLYFLRQDYAMKDTSKVLPIPTTNINASQFENTFVDAASPFLTPSGAIALPALTNPLVLYWNKDLLASAGYSQPPLYWDELFDMARAITSCQASVVATHSSTVAGCDRPTLSIKKATVALGSWDNVRHAKDIMSAVIMQQGGAITARDDHGNLGSALLNGTGGPSSAVQSAVRYYTEFSDPTKDDYSWNASLPDSLSAFASGNLALYIGTASEAALIAKSNPNLNVGIAPLPQVRGSTKALTTGTVYALAIPKVAKNTQGAYLVAYGLVQPGPAASLSSALGLPSARRDVLTASQGTVSDGVFTSPDSVRIFAGSAIAQQTWTDPDPVQTDAAFKGLIVGVTSGAVRLDEAVQRADQEFKNALGSTI